MDSDDRLSRERYDMEKELARSKSQKGGQHGLPSIPPLGASGASSGGGSLIRMGEVITNSEGRPDDRRGHPGLPEPLGLHPRKRGRSPSPSSSYQSKGGSRIDSYAPPGERRPRDYDYDYRSRGDDYDEHYGRGGRGYPEDCYRGRRGYDDYDHYYDRHRGYDDYAYDYGYDYGRRNYYDDGYGYDHHYGGYDDYMRRGRDPREPDSWFGSGADADSSSHASARNSRDVGEPFDPFKNPGLLNFRSYAALAKSAGHPSVDAKDKLFAEYTAYRLEFQKRLLRNFFEANHDKVWFKEKYATQAIDGEDYAAFRKERVKKGRSGTKSKWLQELRAGEIDRVCWDLRVASQAAIEEDASNPVDPANKGMPVGFSVPAATFTRDGKERIQHENAFIPPDPSLLFILSLPPDQARRPLERALEQEPGYQYLALGEPNPIKQGMRVAWARFDEGVDIEGLVAKLNPITVDNSGMPQVGSSTIPLGTVSKRATARLRMLPEHSTSLQRMRFDLFQARRLVALFEEQDRLLFDAERSTAESLDVNCVHEIYNRAREMKGASLKETLDEEEAREKLVEENWRDSQDKDSRIVLESDEAGTARDLDKEQLKSRKELVRTLLDLHIDCLRQVWHFDYYSSARAEFPEELVRRAPLCVRKCPEDGKQVEESKEKRGGPPDEFWAKGLDDRSALLLDTEPDLVPHGGVNLQDWQLEEAKVWVQEAGPEKFRCTIEVSADDKTVAQQCGKLFKGSMFVQKHVLNKHRAFFDEKISAKLQKEKLYNLYVGDPARPMSHYQVDKKAGNQPLRRAQGGFDRSSDSHSSDPRARGIPNFAVGNGPIRLGASTSAEPGGASHHFNHSSRASSGGGESLIRMGASRPSTSNDFDEASGPRNGSGFRQPSDSAHDRNGNGDGSLSSRLGPKAVGNSQGFGNGIATDSFKDGGQSRNQKQNQNFSNGNPSNPQSLPLSANPQPVDPRASKQQSYHDLDGPAAGSEEMELNY